MFCTYLTIYSGKHLPPFYIGSTSIEKINSGYLGSVSSVQYHKIWKSETTNHPEHFRTIIISIHTTREEALKREEEFQRSLNVVRSPLYINMAYANMGFIKQGNVSETTKMRLKEAWKTRPAPTPEAIKNRKIAAQNRKPVSPETGAKLAIANTKWVRTPEMKHRMSEAAKKRKPRETASPQARANMSAAQFARKHVQSETTRLKIAQKAKERYAGMSIEQRKRGPTSIETRQKISLAHQLNRAKKDAMI